MNDYWFDEYLFEIAAPQASAPAGPRGRARRRADRAAGLGPDGEPGLSLDRPAGCA